MNKNLLPIVSPEDLLLAGIPENLILIDARSGSDASDKYRKGHLKNALHVDLEKDLSASIKDPVNGGRHPLPDLDQFALFLGNLGIKPSSHVVVYDDKGGANAAARFWWMLKSVGHDRVQVMDGGMQAAVEGGWEVSDKDSSHIHAEPYPVKSWKGATVTIDNVADAAKSPDHMVIDVREEYRYKGESEPIDLVAGHIPGAVNIPYSSNMNAGKFLDAAELKNKYAKVLEEIDPENVYVHCGSGVTACHTLLALEQAGIKGAKLYVGSWSEWSRSPREIAKEV